MRLIDADELYKDICDSLNQMTKIGIMVDGEWLWAKLNDALENAPTIEAVRKGKWEEHPFDEDWDICSVCGFGTKRREHGNEDGRDWVVQYVYDFCPRCGARLEEA